MVICAIESRRTFRAQVPVRDSANAIVQWREEELSVSTPSGIARAASVYELAEQIPKFIARTEQRAQASRPDEAPSGNG